MNTQKAAKWFGWIILLIGILGFIPGVVTPDGLLFGIFAVNPIHNIIHILTGLLALFSASSFTATKSFFKIFGVIYLLITLLGLFSGSILGLFAVNMADNLLHVVITLVALYYGFRKEGAMVM
jgi:type III secretory pathway component EscU